MRGWARQVVKFRPSFTSTGVHKNANVMSILQPHFKEIATKDLGLTLFGGTSGIGLNFWNQTSLCPLTSDPQELLLCPRAKGRGGAKFIHSITSPHETPPSLVLLVITQACFNATNYWSTNTAFYPSVSQTPRKTPQQPKRCPRSSNHVARDAVRVNSNNDDIWNPSGSCKHPPQEQLIKIKLVSHSP